MIVPLRTPSRQIRLSGAGWQPAIVCMRREVPWPPTSPRSRRPGLLTKLGDTTGLLMHRNRRAFSRGQGEPDGPGYDMAGPVWGADGPAPVYRRSALLAARLPASHGGWGVLDEDVLRDLPWIAAREVMLLGFMLVADPRRLSAITATLRLTRAALHKRHWLKHAERQWRGG